MIFENIIANIKSISFERVKASCGVQKNKKKNQVMSMLTEKLWL